MKNIFDIVIIGSGPSGLTAAVYAKRAGKNVLVIERSILGGQVATISEIENYPGFSKIAGIELADSFVAQAKQLGVVILQDELVDINHKGKMVSVICKKSVYKAKALILALGSSSRHIGAEGEQEFLGRGVSYCATCDGNFFRGKNVIVVGSGDSAVSNALYLKNICANVSIISKYPQLKLKSFSQSVLSRLDNVKIYYGSNVKKIIGKEFVEAVVIDSQAQPILTDGVFVAIGRIPDTDFLKNKITLDEKGFIVVDENMCTSMKGVYACGDVISSSIKQIVTAAASGVVVATKVLSSLN